jgi:conjugal transfer pilus assembly protein TraB
MDGWNGFWYSKSPEERQRFRNWSIVGVLFVLFAGGKTWSENRTGEEVVTVEPAKEISITSTTEEVLEKDIVAVASESIDKKISEAEINFKENIGGLTPISEPTSIQSQEIVTPQGGTFISVGQQFPVPPNVNSGEYGYTHSEIAEEVEYQPVEEVWQTVGGIASGGATKDQYMRLALDAPTPSKGKKVTLPVGFMKARLLVGINARSGEFGQNNPQQLVFRVQAPAQLPNKMKMDLAGCFAVANAFGDMSSGRIEALPVSLSCITHKGKYIAEANDLKGFVQDRDGKRGLDARVVSRARHLLAASVFARSVEAFGSLGVAQGMVTSNSALGSVQTVDNDKLVQTALAKGAEGGASDLSEYLLDLAKQTHPVMEHGAGKAVLLWLAKTTELEIVEMKQ